MTMRQDYRLLPPPLLRVLGFLPALSLIAFSGCTREPFSYVKVSGRITYEDGTVIPAGRIKLVFISQTPPNDPKLHPRPGYCEVDVATGDFSKVTSHFFGDGVVPGDHKVTAMAFTKKYDDQPNWNLIPRVYSDPTTTPLLLNTDESPFVLKMPKPANPKPANPEAGAK